MRVLGGVHHYHGILVEEPRVALNDDIKFAAVLKRGPGAAIGKHISIGSGCDVERGPYALTDLPAPKAFVLRDVDACGFPKIKLGDVCARAIAARDVWRSVRLDGLQRHRDVAHALDAGRITLRTD